MENEKSLKKFPAQMYVSTCVGVAIIINCLFRWYMVDAITVFIQPFLELFLGLAFIIITVSSVVYFVKNVSSKRYFAAIPLSVNIITLLIVIFIPFTDIMLGIDYRMNKRERETVISMVKSGELKPNVSYNENLILLPNKYKHLSKGGGEIIVEKNKNRIEILFFTFRGVLDNFSGFIYTSDGQKPTHEDYKQVIKKDENWFYGAAW